MNKRLYISDRECGWKYYAAAVRVRSTISSFDILLTLAPWAGLILKPRPPVPPRVQSNSNNNRQNKFNSERNDSAMPLQLQLQEGSRGAGKQGRRRRGEEEERIGTYVYVKYCIDVPVLWIVIVFELCMYPLPADPRAPEVRERKRLGF